MPCMFYNLIFTYQIMTSSNSETHKFVSWGKDYEMKPEEVININTNILGGTPVFMGTRVPVEILFDHLEKGISIADFLEDYPSVSQQQVVAVLEIAGKLLSSHNLKKIYEAAA